MRHHTAMPRASAWAWALVALAGPAQAQFFMTPAYFAQLPQSQIAAGPAVDQLVLSNTATDFTVSGTYSVPLAPGPASGVVARWRVERPLAVNLNMGFQQMTVFVGFSAPPPGSFNPSGGWVDTWVEELSSGNVVPGSVTSIPINLQSGAATWLVASVSPQFMLNTVVQRHVLRQEFVLFGDYLGGPGGTWLVDVPITTTLSPVPEAPMALMWAGAGLLGLLRRRRERC